MSKIGTDVNPDGTRSLEEVSKNYYAGLVAIDDLVDWLFAFLESTGQPETRPLSTRRTTVVFWASLGCSTSVRCTSQAFVYRGRFVIGVGNFVEPKPFLEPAPEEKALPTAENYLHAARG